MSLVAQARQAQAMAYAPYSKFHVGAALECENGTVYLGCNVENCSYGGTVCAERVAIFKAVSEGQTRFRRIAVATNTVDPAAPCGFCRQVLVEFCGPDFEIILVGAQSQVVFTLGQLQPIPFTPASLGTL
jgi:cytidine deaminase